MPKTIIPFWDFIVLLKNPLLKIGKGITQSIPGISQNKNKKRPTRVFPSDILPAARGLSISLFQMPAESQQDLHTLRSRANYLNCGGR